MLLLLVKTILRVNDVPGKSRLKVMYTAQRDFVSCVNRTYSYLLTLASLAKQLKGEFSGDLLSNKLMKCCVANNGRTSLALASM